MLKPGEYKNKRGEKIKLKAFNIDLLIDDHGFYYTENGVCMYWYGEREMYVPHHDNMKDIDPLYDF